MIDEKLEDIINEQINAEMYSSYLYLSMAAYFEEKSLAGFANWMKIQAQEELLHAMKFFDYVVERGGRVELTEIQKPPMEWESPLDAFQNAYQHETKVTGMINEIVDLAIKLKDHASVEFLNWYVKEQVEEEASADEIVQQLKIIGDSGHGILLYDRELGGRPEKFPLTLEESAGE